MFCRIDATEETAMLGRLVNHCSSDPNCTMMIVEMGCDYFPCLFARRDINAGEEIVFNYGIKVPFEVSCTKITMF